MSGPDEVVARARAGDGESLALLLMGAEPVLRAAAERDLSARFASMVSAEDIVQQTFVDACRDVAAFRGGTVESFTAWLKGIARQNLLDVVRMLDAARRGGGRRPASLSRTDSSAVLAADLFGARGPSTGAARAEAGVLVAKAIGSLPEAYRAVVERFDLDGRPMEAVAAEIGRSVGAAYMIRARAHRMLREFLGSSGRFFSQGA